MPASVLDNKRWLETSAPLIPTAINDRTYRRCALRGRFAIVCLIVIYLLSGALHNSFDMDVTTPENQIVLSMASVHSDTNAPGMHADHHCHGCFPVSRPNPPVLAVTIEPQAAAVPRVITRASDLVQGIDTPPPKLLS